MGSDIDDNSWYLPCNNDCILKTHFVSNWIAGPFGLNALKAASSLGAMLFLLAEVLVVLLWVVVLRL